VTRIVKGRFDVKLTPQPRVDCVGDPAIGRMAIEKAFHGDLEATSRGEMLATQGSAAGSAGYVALERVQGTLAGRTGTFALQHFGLMTRGLPHLQITVVPDSGTAELEGIAGTMTIDIVEKKHFYTFEFTLPGDAHLA
jgi:hypothetical protein